MFVYENRGISTVDNLVRQILHGERKYFVGGKEDGLKPYFTYLRKGIDTHLGISFDTAKAGDIALVFDDNDDTNIGRTMFGNSFDTFALEDLKKLSEFAIKNIGKHCAIFGVSGSFHDSVDNDYSSNVFRNTGYSLFELAILPSKITFDNLDSYNGYPKELKKNELYIKEE